MGMWLNVDHIVIPVVVQRWAMFVRLSSQPSEALSQSSGSGSHVLVTGPVHGVRCQALPCLWALHIFCLPVFGFSINGILQQVLLSCLASFCHREQVRLPATTKSNTWEAGADVKESGLFSGAGHLEDGGVDSHVKAHPHISVEAEVFIRRERGTEQRDRGRGLESSVCADEHSPFW